VPIRKKIEEFVFKELPGQIPFGIGCIEKMSGYPDKYKARFRQFQIGLTIDSRTSIVRVERVGDRKNIYKIFP